MAKTLADSGNKIGMVDGTEEAPERFGWQIWVFCPLALATIAGAFLVVRRRFGENKHI